MKKQELQCFYTKKVMMLCVFFFFSLGSQLNGQDITGDKNQVVEPARGGEINDLEEGHGLNEKRLGTSLTLLLLSQNDQEEVTDEQVNQLFDIIEFDPGEMIFLFNENGMAKISHPSLKLNLIAEEENDQASSKKNRACQICRIEFKEMKGQPLFLYDCNQRDAPHIFCYECYQLWQKKNKNYNQRDICPICRSSPVPTIPEDIPTKDKIRQLKNTGKINYVERNQQEPSHWKLYLRKKDYDEKIMYETRINHNNLIIVDGSLSDMEGLELNVNSPENLEEYHIKLVKGLKFHKVKFNDSQEPREIYWIFESETLLKILHNGSVVFNESADPTAENQTEVIIKNWDFKRKIWDRVICRYIYKRIDRVDGHHNHIFVFNKENIEYLKETKGLVIFDWNIEDGYIGLEGDEIISTEDVDGLFIIPENIGLMCDNIKNFKAIKTSEYCLLSPIDLPKINKMRKEGYKIPIATSIFYLNGYNCFLLPLFEISSSKKIYILLEMGREMIEEEIAPHKKVLEELKKTFSGIKIKGKWIDLNFGEYAIVLLLYFDENALNVISITLTIPTLKLEYNDIWEELTRKGGSVLKKQTIKKQIIQKVDLNGEGLDFAANVKIMEKIKFKELKMTSKTMYINENFVCNKTKDKSIMRNELDGLALHGTGIKNLLYFKEINILDELEIVLSDLTGEDYPVILDVLARVRANNIQFFLPIKYFLSVGGLNEEETMEELKKGIVSFGMKKPVIDFGEITVPFEFNSTQ